MIAGDHGLSITRQAKALGISRGGVCHPPRPVSATDLAVMGRMDESHLEFPFAGSRIPRDLLNREALADLLTFERMSSLAPRKAAQA